MTKFITVNERAAAIAIELVVGSAGLAAITSVYKALNAAEATGRDDGYNEGFGACLSIMQPDPVTDYPVYTVHSDSNVNPAPTPAEVAAAEAVIYGK